MSRVTSTQKMCLQTQHYDWKNIYNKYYYVYYINLYILLLYYKKNCICLSHFMYFIFILITMIYTDKKYIRLCISSSSTTTTNTTKNIHIYTQGENNYKIPNLLHHCHRIRHYLNHHYLNFGLVIEIK